MQRTLWTGIAALFGLALLGSIAPVWALRVAVQPAPAGPALAANADTIVVGRIVAIEDQDIEAAAAPKSEAKLKYRVALLMVTDVLRGPKDAKTIRVAAPMNAVNAGGINVDGPVFKRPIRPGFGGFGNLNLQVGMDGMFFLNKHHKENMYVANNAATYLAKEQGDFQQQVNTIRKSLKVLDNTNAALKGKDVEEKLMAAGILIQKYRQFSGPGAAKTEPIDAEESKLILNALLEGNWGPQTGRFDPNAPMHLFQQLGVTEKDGFKYPQAIQTPNDVSDAIKTWLKNNANTYRIQRFVNAGGVGVNPGVIGQPPVLIQPGVQPLPIQIQPAPGGVRPLPIRIQPGQIRIQPLPAPLELPAQPDQPAPQK